MFFVNKKRLFFSKSDTNYMETMLQLYTSEKRDLYGTIYKSSKAFCTR